MSIIKEVEKIEILTLQDNYVDLTSIDNSPVIQRAMPVEDMEIKNSILAEHGFSALLSVTSGGQSRSMLFDFGFSADGAASNAETLGADMSGVEVMALSHGHLDHVGGLEKLVDLIGKEKIKLVLHPAAFTGPRYVKPMEEVKIYFPHFTREKAEKSGLEVVESTKPLALLDGVLLFLGEIARETEFEKGMPNAFYEEKGKEKWDPIADDTALVANVKGKGLVVLSGCAHSGVVNTVNYAREVTGVEKIHAVMGGFHLAGPAYAHILEPTIKALQALEPDYIIPTHCTGREAIMKIEKEMSDAFILNMSGTKLTFAS